MGVAGNGMVPLILFIVLGILVLAATEVHERRRKPQAAGPEQRAERPEGCCGEHLVCERETLLQTEPQIVYYDDEELDALADTDPGSYTAAQHHALRQVFDTLAESDVAGWCRSLQMRHIELPPDIREEALMIVREQRATSSTQNRPSYPLS